MVNNNSMNVNKKLFSPRKTFYCIYSIRTTNILIDCSCRIDKHNTSYNNGWDYNF